MISSPSECAAAKRPNQTCYRVAVSTIGSKDIVLQYTVPKIACDGCGTLDSIRSRIAALTPREREVFLLVIRGNLNKQIAHVLGCTERTIKAHRQRVMEKMQVEHVAELVSLAERVGIASADGQTA